MKLMKFLLIAIILFAIAYVFSVAFITSHEAIHSYIFTRYEVANKVSFDFFPIPKGAVVPTANYENCNDFCKSQHALNDIVGYNLVVFSSLIAGLFFCHLFYQYLKDKNENGD